MAGSGEFMSMTVDDGVGVGGEPRKATIFTLPELHAILIGEVLRSNPFALPISVDIEIQAERSAAIVYWTPKKGTP